MGSKELAPIQYVGAEDVTEACLDAVRRLVQYGDRITRARLLTAGERHGLLLTVEPYGEVVAVKTGFSSGYPGEGPRGLAEVLSLLQAVGAELDEWEIAPRMLERLNAAALLAEDLAHLDTAVPRRPRRWHEYLHVDTPVRPHERMALQRFPLVIPWALIDARLMDLALGFFTDPDKAVMDGFRRLEDILRARTGLSEHGVKLFSAAFLADGAPLTWHRTATGTLPEREKGRKEPVARDKAELVGRANLFTAAFQAYRNPRAHREPELDAAEALSEFLLLNQLFRLEAEAVDSRKAAP